ncbi:MAG: putative solute-binding protein [Nannocystaceae bacterium]
MQRTTRQTTLPRGSARRRRPGRALLAGALGLSLYAAADDAAAAASVDKSLCVFDPGGESGDIYAKMEKYQASAVQWGVNFTLRAYTNETVAAADFRNKKCDAVLLTGITGKEFNPKTYTLEAMGLFRSYDDLKKAIGKLANPSYDFLNKAEAGGVKYETAGVYPGGAVYLYLRDRAKADLSALAGQQIATIDNDAAANFMVDKIGAISKLATIATFASMFNNGSVDACYAPATAYGPLELRRGLGKGGGVVRFPLAQLTFQVFVRPDEFPEGFTQSSRTFVADNFGAMRRVIDAEEAKTTPWIDISADDAAKYNQMLADVRAVLRDRKVYDKATLTLFDKK